MFDLDDLDQAWNEYFELDQITPEEYEHNGETDGEAEREEGKS